MADLTTSTRATSSMMRRIAHIRFARAKRWLTGQPPDVSSFNAWVALCEALLWRNRAKRRACEERISISRARAATIGDSMKGPSDA